MRFLRLCLIFFIFSGIIFFNSYQSLQSETHNKIHYIPVKGEINFGQASFIRRAIIQAVEENSSLIILGVDTFGGRVDAALEIVNHIDLAKDIPVYAYVEDKAWSAGALISLACQKIIMRGGSTIGSAAPVTGEGKEVGEKHVSALRAKFRAVAEKNGYPVNVAMAMVDKKLQVQQVVVGGQTKYLTKSQIENLKEENKELILGDIISQAGKLLNLSYLEAKSYDISSYTVGHLNEIPRLYNLETAAILKLAKTWAEHLAVFFTNALVSSILLSIGFMLIYLEFAEPGLGWAGIFALICFGLFFFGRYIVNLAEWIDILLFGLGFLLIFLELFVIPDFGISGIIGGILILISLYLSLSPYRIPQEPWDFDTLQRTLLIILSSLTVSIAGGFALLTNLDRFPFLRKVVLDKAISHDKTKDRFAVRKPEKLRLGDCGEAVTNLRPVGKVVFKGDIYDGTSEQGYIQKGKKVKIVEISGNRILVREEV